MLVYPAEKKHKSWGPMGVMIVKKVKGDTELETRRTALGRMNTNEQRCCSKHTKRPAHTQFLICIMDPDCISFVCVYKMWNYYTM